MQDWKNLEARKAPIKMSHYKVEIMGSNVTKSVKKKDYEYYICDFCGKEIVDEKDVDKRTGGLVEIPINDFNKLKLALCNKCLKPALKAIKERYRV